MSAEKQAGERSTAEFIARNPVFELGQMANQLGLRGGVRAAHERAKHHLAQGRLIRVSRGIYAAVPAGVRPGSFVPDKFLVARAARPDSVYCYHSALELHGVAQSLWNDCTVFTARRRGPIPLGGGEVHFLSIPSAIGSSHGSFAETTVHRMGTPLLVSSPERTVVEGFRRPGRTGGLGEHFESCSALGVLDLELVIEVLRRYGERRLWSAIGWFLEHHRSRFFVTSDHLRVIADSASDSPIYLDRGDRGGRLLDRWNLIVPEALLAGMEGDRG